MKKLRTKGFTLVEIMIVVAIIGILITIAVPGFLRARENARGRACQENLAKIDGSKEQYALENNLSNGSACDMSNLVLANRTGYMRSTPACPSGGSYTVAVIGTDPSCSIGTTNAPFEEHVLQ